MKCKVFTGEYGEVVVEFNNWAKGKTLNKDIIIHTSVHHIFDTRLIAKLSIVVLYPEGSPWDKEPEQPKIKLTEAEVKEIEDNAIGVIQ